MSPTRRIALNILATYGRSLYALIIGLFCGRWTLMILGEIDYGLLGLVGGLIAVVSYFQRLLSGGVSRFYALCIGEEEQDYCAGLEHCRQWFTTSMVVNITIPLILLAVCFPVGKWVIGHYLTIPPDRINACVWVWRFSCFSFIIGLMCAPFNTMYSAKQEIAEQTIYGFVTTTINVLFLYYAVNHPGDWLVVFAGWSCMLALTPSLIMAFRSFKKYDECRFKWKYIRCWNQVKLLLWWNGWLTFGATADLLRKQGMSILINKGFGPRMNASWSVGDTLSNHSTTLSGSLLGAFYPAVYNAWGAGRYDDAKRMGYRVCRLSAILVLIFAIPLALEMDQVLVLWLKSPPKYAAEFSLFVLVSIVIEKMTDGIRFIINANGNVALYQIFVGGSGLSALPIALIFLLLKMPAYYVGLAVVISWGLQSLMRVYLGRRLVGLSVKYWITKVFLPLCLLISCSFCIGMLPRLLMPTSTLRIIITIIVTVGFIGGCGWLILLDKEERQFILEKANVILANRSRK